MKIVRIAMAALALGSSFSACAWMALAKDGSNYFVAHGYDSKQEAQEQALEGCRARYSRMGCKEGFAVNGSALVIAEGPEGAGAAADPDPQKARGKAMKNCAEVSPGCKVVRAYWDPGVTWTAVAYAETALKAMVNGSSKEEAEADALAGCAEQGGTDCKIHPPLSRAGRGYMAIAHSPRSYGVAMRKTLDEARAEAVRTCNERAPAGEVCKVTSQKLNDSNLPEPATMAGVLAEVSRNTATAPAAPRPRTTKSTTRSSNYTSCRNNCVNGACVRSFADGRTERWQAPRVYNPATGNWEWDITTNACGL